MIDKDALLAKRERASETVAVKVIDITIGKNSCILTSAAARGKSCCDH